MSLGDCEARYDTHLEIINELHKRVTKFSKTR